MLSELLASGRWRALQNQSVPVTLRSPFLVFILSALVGCGASIVGPQPVADAGFTDAGVTVRPDGGTSFTDAGLLLADACPTLNRARCTLLTRCGLIDDAQTAFAACVAQFEATWCGPLTWLSHVSSGALRYDAQGGARCVLALEEQSCGTWSVLPALCTTFLTPHAQLGEPCFDGYGECADGVCRGATCPRTCQVRATAGEVCVLDGDCRSGLVCKAPVLGSGNSVCATPGVDGTACLDSSECAEGSTCLGRECRRLGLAGESCTGGLCAPSAYCDVSSGCVARVDQGEPCTGEQCMADSVCDPLSRTCVPATVTAGNACVPAQACPSGQACLVNETQDSVCQPLRSLGAACLDSSECETNLSCRGEIDAGLTCQPRAGAGERCQANRDCQPTATCLEGTCVALPMPGEDCTATRRCRWGLCRDSIYVDGGGVCGSTFSAGQPCKADDECSSGQCNGSLCTTRCAP